MEFVKRNVELTSQGDDEQMTGDAMSLLKKVRARKERSDGLRRPSPPFLTFSSQFNFPRRRWQARVSSLSGGEKRRLQLLQVVR